MPDSIPVIDEDLFSRESVRNARAVDDHVRELAPVVRLAREDIVVMGRFAEVSTALSDWRSFSSTSRPWHDPSSVRPEILLTDDPPRHTEVRLVIANALSPKALKHMAAAFAADAEIVVDRVLDSGSASFDAVATICRPFVYKVLPDLLGLPVRGREHMEAFGHMVWATMGPMNELFHEAMVGSEPVLAWVEECCNRENLDPGLGRINRPAYFQFRGVNLLGEAVSGLTHLRFSLPRSQILGLLCELGSFSASLVDPLAPSLFLGVRLGPR